MQKKLLLSLVCTVPAALPALANVALTVPEAEAWGNPTIGSENVTVDGTTVTCKVGVGSVSQEVKNLPAGKYKISFATLKNAAYTVAGATVDEDGVFELAVSGDITITVAAENPSLEFGFTGGQLTFVEDFSKKGEDYTAALAEAYKDFVALQGDATVELKAEEKTITDEYNALVKTINALGDSDKNADEAVSVDDLIKIYTSEKVTSFSDLFTKIETRIADLKTAVEAFKPKAEASNEAYQIAQDNAKNLASLNNSIDWLLNNTTGSADSSKGVNVLIAALNDKDTNKDVKEANLPGAEAALAAINDLKAAVEEAFEGATELVDVTGFKETIATIKQDLIEKWAKYENDVVAVDIFEDIQGVYASLKPQNAYLNAVANIGAITDSENYGGTDVYASNKTAWLTELQNINSTITEPSTFEDVDASLGVEGYTENINNAIAEMNKVVADAKSFAKNQNDLYDAGYELYAKEDTGWDAVMKGYEARVNAAMPAALTEQYKELLATATEAIKAFKANLDTTYSETALPGESYDADVKAVNDALDAIKVFLEGDYGTVTGLQAALDKIKDANAESFTDLNGDKYPEYAVPTNKFDSQYAAIQAAIDKIIADMNEAEDLKADATAVSETTSAIESLKKGSNDFFEAFTVTHNELINALDNLAAFKKVIDEKYCAETGKTFISDEETDYTDLRNDFEGTEDKAGFKELYLAAAKAVGNASLEQAQDLAGKLNGKAAEIVAAQKTWNTEATQANLDFANARLAELQNFMAEHKNLKTSVKFTDITTALGKVTVPTDGDTAKCTAADKAVKTQMDAMKALYASVQNYLAVTEVLDKITTGTEEKEGAAAAATAANDRINGETPAAEFYQTEIDGYADVSEIQKAIDEAFNAKDGVTDDIKTAQVGAATDKLNSLEKMEEKMLANWTNYSNQISDSGITRDYVQAILDNVKDAQYPGVVEDWVKALEDLLNVRLIDNDKKAIENYGKGNSVGVNTEITAEYKAIRDAADAIAAQYTEGYDARIIEQNNAINGEFSDWAAVNKQLNDGYLAAVNLYNFYKNQLTEEAGYRAWMLDDKYNLVANYAEVYDVLPAIQSLNAQISALISQANAAKEYLPESEQYKAQYEQLVADQAAELAKLQALYEGLTNDADKAAQEYYDAKVEEYKADITESIATLEAAGLTNEEATAGLKGISDVLAAVDEYINDDKQTLTLGEAMNVVARDKFAGIDFPAAITAAVDAKWAAEYELNYNGRPGKAATETEPAVEKVPSVAELRGTMADNGAVKAELDAFDAIVKKMEALNTKATTVDEKNPLIDNLKDYIEELEGYRANLEKMAATAVENQQYKDLYNGYMAGVGELQDLIDILNEYIAGYTLQGPVTVSPDPEVLLGELKAKIGDKPSAAIAGDAFKATVEEYTENIMAAIDAKKEAADAAGLATLKTWIENTKVAYNTAVANDNTLVDKLTGEYNTIQDVNAWWQEYAGRGDKGFAVDFPALVTEQLETILETYRKLNPDGAASDLAAIQQDLADQKADIEKAIDEAKEALDELVDEDDPDYEALVKAVHDALDPEFDALNTELDNLEGQWTAEGDKLLVNSYEYVAGMKAVEGKISGISDKGADTLAAARKSLYNAQAAASLNEEWTKLNEFYAEVVAKVQSYELERMYGRQIGVIESMLDKLKTTIESEADDENLTKESTINDEVFSTFTGSAINSAIQDLAAEAAVTQASWLYEEARAALDETYDALVGKYLINGYSLRTQWQNLNDLYKSQDFSSYAAGTRPVYTNMEKYEAFMDTFQSIIDGAKQIAADAENKQYTPGVVVERDAKKVRPVDVMKLVNWVGEGVTYGELAENEETAWQAAAADINFDGDIDIADINIDIDLMLGRYTVISDGNLFNPTKKPAAVANDAGCTLAYLGEVDGNDRYAVAVNNPTAFIGGQLDIKLPVGMTLVGVSATERTQGHEVMSFEHDAYTTRVLIFNMDNEAIGGNSGAVLYIDVQGHGSFSLDGVLFTDSEYHLHGFGNPGTSGIIDAIIDGAGAAKEAIYDAAGRMYDRVQRGVNIIRHSDGSVTKELRK